MHPTSATAETAGIARPGARPSPGARPDGSTSPEASTERNRPGAPGEVARTPSGRTVRLEQVAAEDLLTVSSPDGDVEMEIRFTDSGPVLRFPSAALRLESEEDVEVACRDFRVRARGEVDLEAEGAARLEGHAVEVRSRRRDVRVRANDDVRIDGERVLLNC